MIAKTKKNTLIKLALLYGGGMLFLGLTDPARLPVPLLIVPFLWLFVALFITANHVVSWRAPNLARKRRVVVAGVCATLPVLLLVFESIHQLSLKDLLIALALVICASFYMLRADFID